MPASHNEIIVVVCYGILYRLSNYHLQVKFVFSLKPAMSFHTYFHIHWFNPDNLYGPVKRCRGNEDSGHGIPPIVKACGRRHWGKAWSWQTLYSVF